MCRIVLPVAPIQVGFGQRADRRPDCFGKRDHRFAGTGLGKPDNGLAGRDNLSRLTKRLHDRSVRIRHQDGICRLVLGHLSLGFRRSELCIGCIRRGLRLLVALFGSPSVVDQVGVSPLISFRLNDSCARRGNRVALRRKREAEVGFVDPHQRLPSFDLLADIHEPFDDLPADAKAKVAFHPRADRACEAAFGSAHPRGAHQADHGRVLPRISRCGGFMSGNGKSSEDGCSGRRGEDTCQDHKSALFHRRLHGI